VKLRCLIFTFLCLIIQISSVEKGIHTSSKSQIRELERVLKTNKGEFFAPFFLGLKRLGLDTGSLFRVVDKLNSFSLSGFDEDSNLLGGFGSAGLGFYNFIRLNPTLGSGLNNFDEKGNLEKIDAIHPAMADVVIHEFWHAYRFFFLDKDSKAKALFEKIRKSLRKDGLDEAVKYDNNLSLWSKISNAKLTEEALLEKYSHEYADEAIAFFLGTAIKATLASERMILEHNLKLGLTHRELKFILGLKPEDELQSDSADSRGLKTFVLPSYLSLALNFHSYSNSVFLEFGKQSKIPPKSRDYNFSFVTDLQAYSEPYYYSGFKNWSSIRPSTGAVKLSPAHGVAALKTFMDLDFPADLKALLGRMNSSSEYADLRQKLASRRKVFLLKAVGHARELSPGKANFLSIDDISGEGGK
jgi:hypothetical protein